MSNRLRIYRQCIEQLPKIEGRLLHVGSGKININDVEHVYTAYNCDLENHSLPNFKNVDLNGEWSYDNESFEAILSVEVLEHLENPWHFMREVKRLLKLGGYAVITTPNNESDISKKIFSDRGRFHWFLAHHVTGPLRHITPIFSWQFEFICKEVGLELIDSIVYSPVEPQHKDDNWIFVVRKK